MAKGSATGYVLDPEHHLTAPQEIPGFPGVFSMDTPVLAETIMAGLDLDHVGDVDDRIKELGLPLVKVQVSEKDAEAILAAGPQQPPAPPSPPSEEEANAQAAETLAAQENAAPGAEVPAGTEGGEGA